MRKAALALMVLLATSIVADEPTPTPPTKPTPQVTVSLTDYDALRDASEQPSATVIDSIILAGSFRGSDLTIAFAGRATGTKPLVKALEQTNEVTIYNCKGDGIISRRTKGAFDLIPLSQNFNVTCDLRVSGSDRLKLHTPTSVLAVRSAVSDGELVGGDEAEDGARDYTLVRHMAMGPGETIAATATGRYLITLLPDATRFRYAIDVHNPNRTTSTLELRLQSNEHLQQIDSAASYEVREGVHVFSIPPGDSTITMTGELRGTSFIAPVSASLQYLVIESHPLLRPTIETPVKRISVGETGVTPQYRGALAFETGTKRIAWKVTRLEALHAISYAVNNATHRVFIPLDGPILGESKWQIRNEGAAELLLPAEPEPTYVSFDDQPVLMTKNAKGELAVPLSSGEQNVLAQHRQPLHRMAGFVFGSIAVPMLDVPATNTEVVLMYPGQWVPLYQHFASHAQFWVPPVFTVLAFLLLAIWIERILAWLDVAMRPRFAIALLLSLASMFASTLFVLTFLFFALLTLAWILGRPTLRERVSYIMVIFIVALVLYIFSIGIASKSEYGVSSANRDYDTAATDTAQVTDTAGVGKTVDTKAAEPTRNAYQGLPAKFTLPNGDSQTSFQQELLRTDRKQTAFIIAISLALTNAFGLILGVIAAVLVWKQRRKIIGVRDRIIWTRVEGDPGGASPAAPQ